MATSFLSTVTSSLILIVYQVYDDDLTADSVSRSRGPSLRSRLPNYYDPAFQEASPNRCLLHIWGPWCSCELLAIPAEYSGRAGQ